MQVRARLYSITDRLCTLRLEKKFTSFASYNFDIHEQNSMIFGRTVKKETSNKKMLNVKVIQTGSLISNC